MKKQKYRYNQQTLSFERIETPLKIKLLKAFAAFCTVALSSFVLFLFVSKHVTTPREKALQRELSQMEFQYSNMNDQIDVMGKVINNLHERDSRVYEIVFGMEPVDKNIWEGGVGGHEKFRNITDYGKSSEIIKESKNKIDKIERQVVIHSKTLEDIEGIALNRDDMFRSVPSIKPIREDKLRRKVDLLSGFGMRLHPVYKVMKMHEGIDFPCKRGTAIQATGDGVVKEVKKSSTGYGIHVIIDHGFGYTSLYGHCQNIFVSEGDKVVKGQKIADVGNTGTSTAPHLHYEVRFKGKPVNPIHYVMDGLSPEEYADLVDLASMTNQSFD